MKKIVSCILILSILVSCLLCGCSQKEVTSATDKNDVQYYADKKIGCIIGGTHEMFASKAFPNAQLEFFDSIANLMLALKAGQIDAFVNDHPCAVMQVKKTTGAKIVGDIPNSEQKWAIALAKENIELKEQLDEVIIRFRDDGTLDMLNEKWIEALDSDTQVCEVDQNYEAPNGTLTVYCYGGMEGFDYEYKGELVGYEVELMMMLAKECGYKCEFIDSTFQALIPALVSGKADAVLGTLTITEERLKSVLFSESIYTCSAALIASDDAGTAESDSHISLKQSFRRTFIDENRWKEIAKGLLITIVISVCAVIIGTAFGFLFSFPLRSKNPIIRKVSTAISFIIDGVPLVVMLLVLYYIVFAKTSFTPVIVATIGFSIDFSNTTACLINTGASAVSVGQCEAAKTLGFTKLETFNLIVFPQAAQQMFTSYKSHIVNLVKTTAIVGYITVEDLTRVSDIIRSRTYDAFFPLIASAILYFILARFLIALLKYLEDKINPRLGKAVAEEDVSK